MSPTSLPRRRLLPSALPRRRHARLERARVTLADGARTTLHVASYDRGAFTARVAVAEQPLPLARLCQEQGVRHAIVGGFFLRPEYVPLGEVRTGGAARAFVPIDAPWGKLRACVQIDGDKLRIDRRNRLGPEPAGDLLQAGPLLVTDGASVACEGEDPEGFSAGAHQFDSDITRGRYPRAAFGIAGERLLAVACDGRTRADAGMTLAELADAMLALGARDAINLDGGGSASLVHQGRLRNRPREEHGVDLLGGRPIVTAILFEPAI